MSIDEQFTTWSTRAFRPAQQFSRWREAVDATHLTWDIAIRRENPFDAELTRQGLGSANVIECLCDPCDGKRREAQIARSSEGYYGVLHVLQGREMIRQGGREAWLEEGDFVLWDSTEPIDFSVGARLRKITLLVPQRSLEVALPDARNHVAVTMSGRTGRGALFANHLRALASVHENFPNALIPRLTEATIDLLSAAYLSEEQPGTVSQRALFAQINTYIQGRLDDPTLNPESIARAHGISARQLHRVFSRFELGTVERWIWSERLERCRHEIQQAGETTISAIAFKWGFNDAAHFSRAFRKRYGISPRELRQHLRRNH